VKLQTFIINTFDSPQINSSISMPSILQPESVFI